MPPVKELHQYMAQCLAECFSTFMLILIGESGIAQYKFARNGNHSPITVNLSFAIGVYTGNCLLLIYVFLSMTERKSVIPKRASCMSSENYFVPDEIDSALVSVYANVCFFFYQSKVFGKTYRVISINL